MALVDNAWYVDFGNGSSTGYYAVATWSNKTAAAGEIIRQATTPSVGSERCYICVVAGATGSTEPTWTVTRGAKNTSSSAVYQECTGIAALNGDATNTPGWTSIKGTSITLGQVIKRDNGASYQICTTAGTAGSGSEPAFSDTAGTTTADNACTWTSLGVVGNFTGWQAPHARLANAYANNWGQAGNSFYLASEHAETQSTTIAVASPGSLANPTFAYSVNKTNVPPTSANLSAGASLTSTSTGAVTFSGNGSYYKGIVASCGTGAVNTTLGLGGTATSNLVFDDCTFNLVASGTLGRIQFGTTSSINVILNRCSFSFANASQGFTANASSGINTKILGGSLLAGSAIPTTVFIGAPATLYVDGMDLSLAGSGVTLMGSSTVSCLQVFKNCKLGASVTKMAALANASQRAIFLQCDSSATNYLQESYTYQGSQACETTIVRTGGATDGTTPISWKIVTTANSKWFSPYEALPIAVWNDTTAGNVTVTVYGIWGGGAVPNNDDIWIEVSYMGSSATPISTINLSNTKAYNMDAGSAQSSDASSWGGSTTAFKMAVTLSSPQPAMKGPIYVTVKAAKASSTFYIDPKVVLS